MGWDGKEDRLEICFGWDGCGTGGKIKEERHVGFGGYWFHLYRVGTVLTIPIRHASEMSYQQMVR